MGEVRFYLPNELHRKLKAYATMKGVTIRSVIISALRDYLKGE